MDAKSAVLVKGKPLKIVSFLKQFEHKAAVDQRKFGTGTNQISQMKRILVNESEVADDGEPSEKKDKIEVIFCVMLSLSFRLGYVCKMQDIIQVPWL